MASVRAFARNDLRLIKRDPMMLGMFGLSVYLVVVLHFGIPWLDGWLAEEGVLPSASHPERLDHYYPLIISFLCLYTCAVIPGTIFAFLILTEKDDDTLRALLVSPIRPQSWLDYRIFTSVVLAFAIELFVLYGVGIDLLPLPQMLCVAFASAWTAPIVMLFLAFLADGKVQGIAYSKFVSFGGLLIVVSWWFDEPLQYAFGLFPPYWASKAYWAGLAGQGSWPLYSLVAVVTQAAVIAFLRSRFLERVYARL
jgi:fluoroquinolone transport system permease protein